jgi:hypothetical protein
LAVERVAMPRLLLARLANFPAFSAAVQCRQLLFSPLPFRFPVSNSLWLAGWWRSCDLFLAGRLLGEYCSRIDIVGRIFGARWLQRGSSRDAEMPLGAGTLLYDQR